MMASVVWKEGMVFEGVTGSGHRVVTAAPPLGDNEDVHGPRPLELVLVALGSCTAMDVASILRKMRQPFSELRVGVRADRSETHPKVFSYIELQYTVRGDGLDPDQVERAIRLSQEQYCAVAAMLRPAVPMTFTWHVEPQRELVALAS